MKNKTAIIVVIIAIIIVLCCVVPLCIGSGFLLFEAGKGPAFLDWLPLPTEPHYEASTEVLPTEPSLATDLPDENTPMPEPTVGISSQQATTIEMQNLQVLQQSLVPVNDLRDLAARLQDKKSIPETLSTQPQNYQTGDQEKFWVSNNDTHENFQITAELAYSTPHVYFWAEDGVTYDFQELKALVDTFEDKIYPTDREFFGSEWTPGVDNDVHIYILYARNLGDYLGGYFSSLDSVNPLAHQYSNGHETFVFSADNATLSDEYTYGILAHEFQHMIHWYQDRNESSWLNEGFAELAVYLNGYGTGWKDYSYSSNPDMNITYWPGNLADASPNYGAAFLFTTYFLDRFGEETTQSLVAEPENGMDSIDAVFEKNNITDSQTGQSMTADELFRDWTIANFLKDGSVGDGRYTYHNYLDSAQTFETNTINDCSADISDTVNQYGVDYIGVYCNKDFTLHFKGDQVVKLLPVKAKSGDFMFWSNKGDESDMTLTQSFDFSGVTGAIEMNYAMWYDLETDFDFLYVEASEDGENWTILTTPSCTTENISGGNYGCGYNGQTQGWVDETVDLSDYAGKKVTIRFEYVTDAAVNGDGFAIDDISIPAIEYSSDFEDGTGGWEAAGFVRLGNYLPQTYVVSLIRRGNTTTVENLTLSADQSLDYAVSNSSDATETIVVISGTTRFTNQAANYHLTIEPE